MSEIKLDTALTKGQLDALIEQYASGDVPTKEKFFSHGTIEQLDKLYENHLYELSNYPSNAIRVI